MHVYVAGPMRGKPDFNFPAFEAATKGLRTLGHEVFNPAERDLTAGFKSLGMTGHEDLSDQGFDLRAALNADLEYITLTADALCVLSGWENSAGARAEVATAHALGLPVVLDGGFLYAWAGKYPYRGNCVVKPELAPSGKLAPVTNIGDKLKLTQTAPGYQSINIDPADVSNTFTGIMQDKLDEKKSRTDHPAGKGRPRDADGKIIWAEEYPPISAEQRLGENEVSNAELRRQLAEPEHPEVKAVREALAQEDGMVSEWKQSATPSDPENSRTEPVTDATLETDTGTIPKVESELRQPHVGTQQTESSHLNKSEQSLTNEPKFTGQAPVKGVRSNPTFFSESSDSRSISTTHSLNSKDSNVQSVDAHEKNPTQNDSPLTTTTPQEQSEESFALRVTSRSDTFATTSGSSIQQAGTFNPVVPSSTGGLKETKLARYDLVPPYPLDELAKHYGRGALKYENNQWRKGYEWSKSYAALNRHLQAFWDGEDIDEETGSPHLAAVAWHAFTLIQFSRDFPDFDDRFKA